MVATALSCGAHPAAAQTATLNAAASTQPEQPFAQRASPRAPLFKQLRLDGNLVRWQRADNASSLVLTYKVQDEFQAFDGARNCRRMTGIDTITTKSQISRAAFDAELRAALAMWEAAADIRFREADEGEAPNISIGAQADPEGWAFADVFYNSAAPEPVKPISRSLVCLNPTKTWKIGFDGDLRVYDLRYTLAHEIGHAIGLDHPNAPGQIMGYRYEEGFRDLQAGDLTGAVALYGLARSVQMARSPDAPEAPGQAGTDAEQSGAASRALVPQGK